MFLMAFLANYPIAVAPAMGHNFFFAFTVVAAWAIRGRRARSRVHFWNRFPLHVDLGRFEKRWFTQYRIR